MRCSASSPKAWPTASSRRLCDTYAQLFAQAIAPGESAALVERYRRVRHPAPHRRRAAHHLRALARHPGRGRRRHQRHPGRRQAPLSRMPPSTWPDRARTGSCSRPIRASCICRSTTAAARCASAWPPGLELREALASPASIVIDPDSRLTQLGLLPVCPDDRYYFFESRGYGGDGDDPLPVLAGRWAAETFGIAGAPYRRRWAESVAARHRHQPGRRRKPGQAHRGSV